MSDSSGRLVKTVEQPGDVPATPPRDPWYALSSLTPARIALGHVGAALPTSRHLDLQLAHARARDAVWRPFGAAALADAFRADGHQVVRVHSAARDRHEYLARPDLGRRLAPESAAMLATHAGAYDIGVVVGDGLAPLAAEGHAPALARALLSRIDPSWRVAPVVVAEQMRVALGDEVGAALGVRMVVVLIGERPGMSAQDSLGAYVTWAPRVGRSDAERNCVSNVRPEGLTYDAAATTIAWLLREASRRELTGVALRVEPVTEIAGKRVVGSG
jgi:ethanolamine ammonia-lyase small subunit